MAYYSYYKVGDNVYADFEIANEWGCSVTIRGSGYMYDSIEDFQLISSQIIYKDWEWHRNRINGDIVIPDGVKSIASHMFEQMDLYGSIGTLYIGKDVEYIGDNAFYSLTERGVKNIVSNSTVLTTLGANCFEDNKNLVSADFKGTVTTIGYRCFQNCCNIESLNLSENLNTIPAMAFSGCTKLKTFNASNKITSFEISSNASANGIFKGCNNIEFFTIDDDCDFDTNPQTVWNDYFYVDLNKGSNCNEDGLQITRIYTNNPKAIAHNWIGCDNRYPIFQGIEFIYCAHKGKWIKIKGYGNGEGDIPVSHEKVYLWIKMLKQGDPEGTPIFLAHNGKWYQIGY